MADKLFLTSHDMFIMNTKHGTHCFVHTFPYYTNGETILSGAQIGEMYDGTQYTSKNMELMCTTFPH